jgi:hypothetical protein
MNGVFAAGPLRINLAADDSQQYEDVVNFLARYDVAWKDACVSVNVCVSHSAGRVQKTEGNFLKLSRMNVDAKPSGLYAASASGCSAVYSTEENRWDILVAPQKSQAFWEIPNDIDDLLMLVLTTGWRAAGWVPIHAGAISRDETCALVCATSGGGKTTLVSAMVRQGWSTLGDDKLLLRSTEESPMVRALSRIFHLDPQIEQWFPEARRLDAYPSVSPLSEKRRVPASDLWPGCVVNEAHPTHLVLLSRLERINVMRITALSASELLSTMLSQIVIPKEPRDANLILTTVANTTRHVKGLQVEIAGSAYLRPDGLQSLMEAFV